MLHLGAEQFSSLQKRPRMIIECEDSVSPLWLSVFPASRMALKAVCLSLWSLLNTKKNLYSESSQVPVCSQWISSGAILNGAGVIHLYSMTKPAQQIQFFNLLKINSNLIAPVWWQNIVLQMGKKFQWLWTTQIASLGADRKIYRQGNDGHFLKVQ